MLHKEEII